jgi:hypothetical protein
MRKFDFSREGKKRSDVYFNRGGIYCFNDFTNVSFWLEPFQNSPNGRKGLTEPERVRFQFNVDEEQVRDFQIKIEGFDGVSQIFELDEVDPEQLFWIGKLFTDVAKHCGVDMKQQIKLNDEKRL